jgi:sugar-specific transcriptional regulator TrmB
MSPRDEEAVQAKLVARLEALGLSEYEARTLVALLRLETGTAREIADADGVPRTRVYDAVETLHDLGLVDVQHGSPKKFTVVSRDSIVRKLEVDRKNTITEVAELFEQLDPAEPQPEQTGAWTVTGQAAVAQRLFEFVEDADEEVIYMTTEDLLTEEHLVHLRAAAERGVDIYIAGVSESVRDRIQQAVPSAELFETLWAWGDTPAGSLLVTDESTALVSVRVDGAGPDGVDETAIWGSGEYNSLVVVLRSIFTWRLDNPDLADVDDS